MGKYGKKYRKNRPVSNRPSKARKNDEEAVLTDDEVALLNEILGKARKDDGGEEESKDDEFIQELVDVVIEESLEQVKARKDDGEAITESLIEEIVSETAKRKRRKGRKNEDASEDELKDLDVIATEEVIDDMVNAVEEAIESAPDPEMEKDADDPDEESKNDEEQEEAKRRKSRASTAAQQKARRMAGRNSSTQRKYADLFAGRKSSVVTGGRNRAEDVPPMVQLARAIKCLDVWGRGDRNLAAKAAKDRYGDERMAMEIKRGSGMNVSIPSEGGFAVPQMYVDEIIQPLYNALPLTELGTRHIPMPNGNLNLPKMTSGARARWDGERRKIAKTQPALGNLKMSAKRLGAIVAQSRELMMTASYSADELFANDLTMQMQQGLEHGIYFGKGTEFEPLGLANNKNIQNFDAMTMGTQYSDANGVITPDLFIYLRGKVLRTNINRQYLGWLFDDMLLSVIYSMRTTTGDYIYKDELDRGELLGFPYKTTNMFEIDSNGRTGMFFGDWNSVVIGDMAGLETFTTLEGSWIDDDGVTHNAFEENLSATRATMHVDSVLRYDEAMAYVKNIKVE